MLDLTNEKYGKLTVIEEVIRVSKYERRWKCKCECGNDTIVSQRNLRNGKTVSCGCFRLEQLKKARTKHGFAKNKSRSSEYNTWKTMIARCENPKSKSYKYYGAKGIKVCKSWKDFKNFYKDMGPKPNKKYSIDRIDNMKDYSPENCRWYPAKKQARNRSSNKSVEKQYLELLKEILDFGESRNDRTGIGTLSIFAPKKIEIFLDQGYPLLTTKKMAYKNMIDELIWFISGSSNCNDLPDKTKHWWKPWAKEDGELGPVYGKLWRSWPYMKNVDQLKNVINSIKNNPNSRRHIMTTWHPGEIENQALPPCHGLMVQFYVDQDKQLSCSVYQRSADCFIGLPHNLASYSLFLMMIAQVCHLKPYKISYSLGDAHIYKNHIDQVKLQLTREPKPGPKMVINPEIKDIDDFKYEDFKIEGYEHHPAIKGEISV